MMIELTIDDFLSSNPENYYAAKALAVKYDPIIDELNKELLLLNFGTYQNFDPAPNFNAPSLEYFKVYSVNTPDYVEIRRNVLFLLWGGHASTGLNSDRAIHSLLLYPLPAAEQQTLQFELAVDGQVTIDIISSAGKVLQANRSTFESTRHVPSGSKA